MREHDLLPPARSRASSLQKQVLAARRERGGRSRELGPVLASWRIRKRVVEFAHHDYDKRTSGFHLPFATACEYLHDGFSQVALSASSDEARSDWNDVRF